MSPTRPSAAMHREFHRTVGKLIVAIDKWSRFLGYPGGVGNCGRCGTETQWCICPVCQPAEFRRLP